MRLPRDVRAAVEDGRYFTREEYEVTSGRMSSPPFDREVAGFRCAFR